MPKTKPTDDATPERTDHALLVAVSRAHTPSPEHAQALRRQRQVVDDAVDAGLDVPCLAGGPAWITDTAKGATSWERGTPQTMPRPADPMSHDTNRQRPDSFSIPRGGRSRPSNGTRAGAVGSRHVGRYVTERIVPSRCPFVMPYSNCLPGTLWCKLADMSDERGSRCR